MTSELNPPHDEIPPRVAILGTGKMGAAIAGRLAAEGFAVALWNRTRARADALAIGRVCDTPAEASGAADVVISSLTGPDAIRSAYLGPHGALEVGAGKLFIEMSTAGPDIVPELAAAVAAARGRLLVAPILGAPSAVRDGKAGLIVGGSESDLALARPVLARLGSIRHVGPMANAARLKLVSNSMLADLILAAAELQVAGERSGLDPQDVFWVFERFVPVLGLRRHGYVENRHEPTLFAVRDLVKDLDFATGLFKGLDAQTPLTNKARDSFAAAGSSSGDLDITAVILPYREARH
jgi:3-hydroxyisobutyrate dehydrogenase-like beta-hydroxyacid dehydrogenase